MKKLLLLFIAVSCCFTLSAQQQKDTITFMSLNVLNYPNGCGTATVNREDTLRKITQFVQPDIFTICELQEEFGADSILNKSLNVFGNTSYTRASWVPNGSSSNNFQNMLFYNSDKFTLLSQDEITTTLRDINHYILFLNDPFLSVHQDTIYFEVYMAHLKAGTGSTNELERDNMAQLIRNFVDNRPSGRNHILCGDFNVYDDQEPAYQTLTTGGTTTFYDPINQAGNWHDNATYASIHTQSPRIDNWDCGATAGMDDRFDQILVSQNVMNGNDSVTYLSGTYKAVGNDGQHFNDELIAPPSNSMYPDSIVNAVYWMSDHLPITMDVVVSKAWDDVDITTSSTSPSCNGFSDGTATASPSGGTAPYSYQWDAATGNQTTQTVNGLSAGTYCVTVTDTYGYEDSSCVIINEPAPLSLSYTTIPDNGSCNGESTVNVTGGTMPYNYQWDASANNQTTAQATNLCSGNYWCTVTDANNCVDTIEVLIDLDTSSAEISEKQLGHIALSPNPFRDYIKLSLNGDEFSDQLIIQIRSLDGKIVYQKTYSSQEQLIIDCTTLSSATYLLEIVSNKKVYKQKIIKR